MPLVDQVQNSDTTYSLKLFIDKNYEHSELFDSSTRINEATIKSACFSDPFGSYNPTTFDKKKFSANEQGCYLTVKSKLGVAPFGLYGLRELEQFKKITNTQDISCIKNIPCIEYARGQTIFAIGLIVDKKTTFSKE